MFEVSSYQDNGPALASTANTSPTMGTATVVGGATQVTTINGHQVVTSNGYSRYDPNANGPTDIRNPGAFGGPVDSIEDGTLLTINGLQAPASFWAAEGYLVKDAEGYRAAQEDQPAQAQAHASPQASQPRSPAGADSATIGEALKIDGTQAEESTEGATQEAPHADPNSDAVDYSATDAATLNAALDIVAPNHYGTLAAAAVSMATGGLSRGQLVSDYAKAAGLHLDQAGANVDAIADVFQAKADTALTRYGLDADDLPGFYAWAKENHRGELASAVHQQIMGSDTHGYRALVDAYLTDTPPSLQALSNAGIPTRTTDGREEVNIGGIWMTPKAAARGKLI